MTVKLDEAIRAVYTDVYSYHERHCDMKGSDTDWCNAANEMTLLVAKHSGDAKRLAELLLLAVYEFMDEQQKKREDAKREAPHQMAIGEIPWT